MPVQLHQGQPSSEEGLPPLLVPALELVLQCMTMMQRTLLLRPGMLPHRKRNGREMLLLGHRRVRLQHRFPPAPALVLVPVHYRRLPRPLLALHLAYLAAAAAVALELHRHLLVLRRRRPAEEHRKGRQLEVVRVSG